VQNETDGGTSSFRISQNSDKQKLIPDAAFFLSEKLGRGSFAFFIEKRNFQKKLWTTYNKVPLTTF
jgi:hypothetical protein